MIQFGEFRYDPASRILYRGDEEILLSPRVLAVLESLLKRPGKIVPKEELLASAWEGVFVAEDALTQAVSRLRQVLGDDAEHPRYVQTVPRRGYRLIAEVSAPLESGPAVVASTESSARAPADLPEEDVPQSSDARPRTVGSCLGRYEILGPLGSGGMGEVYRARDPALHREVAIKVLPSGAATDARCLRRLKREARALAALDHPHIATVHSYEEENGAGFIVMELVEGPTLADELEDGALPLDRTLRLAAQIARAMEAAHERDIVHRDLKPKNIKVRPDGQVKVVDFGLAKPLRLQVERQGGADVAAAPAGASAQGPPESDTGTGAQLGTAPYMSPEQARGEDVDQRTDIWAFGCVLYEMLTGERPFGDGDAAEILEAILEREPAFSRLPADTPPTVGSLLRRCLRKDPADRLHAMADARIAVEEAVSELPGEHATGSPPEVATSDAAGSGFGIGRRAGTLLTLLAIAVVVGLVLWPTPLGDTWFGGGAPSIESLAVLPLDNLMGDPDQEYFVQGVHESLISELSGIRPLRVISRTSMMRYRDSDKSIPEIAEELDVDAVVEGSVMRDGDRVRITTQLIDARRDQHLWADHHEGQLSEVFAVLDDVALAVGRQVAGQVSTELQDRLAARQPVDPAVQEAMLRGRYLFDQFTAENTQKALEYFEEAISLAPDHAPAWAGAAAAHLMLVQVDPGHEQPTRDAVARALELDPRLGDAHTILGWIRLWHDQDWEGARESFLRALELNPNDTDAYHGYSDYLLATGRPEESLEQMWLSFRTDPVSPKSHHALVRRLIDTRHDAEAEAMAREGLRLFPERVDLSDMLALVLFRLGRPDEAMVELKKLLPEHAAALQDAYDRDGVQGVREWMADLWVEMAESGQVWAAGTALALSAAGRVEEAFTWLERAYEAGHLPGTHMAKPGFDNLRSDPRFDDLRERMGLPPGAPPGGAVSLTSSRVGAFADPGSKP